MTFNSTSVYLVGVLLFFTQTRFVLINAKISEVELMARCKTSEGFEVAPVKLRS